MTTWSKRTAGAIAVAAGLCAVLAGWPGDALAWGAARGARGGGAAWGPHGAVAVGPRGNAVATTRPGYDGHYGPHYYGYGPAVRPPYPAPVPIYPGYVRPVAPLATAAAIGVVAGATAGAVAAANAPPVLVVGATLAALPDGCGAVNVAGISYYQCGPAWVRPYMQGASVAYLVVPAP